MLRKSRLRMNESKLLSKNVTNTSIGFSNCKYAEPESDLEVNVKRISMILVILLGLVGNIFAIILAVKYTARKNLHHLIINMAVSDSVFIGLTVFWNIHWLSDSKIKFPDGPLGDILCNALFFLIEASYRVSLVTLLIISIVRFRATRQTLQRSRPYTLKQRVAMLCFSWLFPMAFGAVYLYLQQIQRNKMGLCKSVSSLYLEFLTHFKFISAWAHVFAMITIFGLSISTIRRLSHPLAIHDHLGEEQRNERARRTKSAVRMVLASVLLYTCCWIPLFIFVVLLNFDDFFILFLESNCLVFWTMRYIIFTILPLVNCCLSPFIYIISLPDFREAAKKVLCKYKIINGGESRRNVIGLQPLPNHRQLQEPLD